MNISLIRLFFRISLVLALIVITYLTLSIQQMPDFPNSDKFAHVIAFFGLTLLAHNSAPGKLKWSMLALLGYGILIELLQGLTSYRQASAADALADAVGIVLYALPASIVIRCYRASTRDKD